MPDRRTFVRLDNVGDFISRSVLGKAYTNASVYFASSRVVDTDFAARNLFGLSGTANRHRSRAELPSS